MQWQRICLQVQETQETWVQFLDLEDPLESEMTTHSTILAWKIPWTGEPGGLQFVGLQSRAPLSTSTDTRLGSAKLLSLSVLGSRGSGRAECLENSGLRVAVSQM